jgi:signal transduction histidine kinase
MLAETGRLRPGCAYGRYVSFESDISRPPHSSRPPLSKRLRPWHWIAIDVVAGGLGGLAAGATAVHDLVTLPSRLLLAAVIFFPIALRRRYPLPAFCALVSLAVLEAVIGWALPAGPAVVYIYVAYVLYTVTVGGSRRAGLVAAAVPLTIVIVTEILVHLHRIPADRGSVNSGWAIFALVVAWMAGDSARQRRRYVTLLQYEAATSAVTGERLRIARELHDVVAHSMNVIAVQAGYGQYVIDTSPADAGEALGAIQATSRDALDEMRRMLGVLRQQDMASEPDAAPEPDTAPGSDAAPGPDRARPAPLAPAPDLDDLGRLIQRARSAGVAVSLERSGQVRAVPAGVGLSAYRIIQEALTNVVKHAGDGARCTVRVGYEETVLNVLIANDGCGRQLVPVAAVRAPAGSGHGLAGMRERAHLCDGHFTAGPLPDGGFQVIAALPLPGGMS